MTTDHVTADLLAYLDGELAESERAHVEEHLAGCAACTAELARLREVQEAVGPTLDATIGSLRLSYEADERIRRMLRDRLERRERAARAPWRQLRRWRGLVAQAVLALLIVVFSASTFNALSIPAPVPAQQTLVLGETQLAPGSRAALRVIVRSAAGSALGVVGSPVAGAEVVVGLKPVSGETQTLFRGETNAQGTADVAFTVPDSPEGMADLVVETISEAGSERLVRAVELVRPHKIYLMSDKPAYRPGQPVRVRALALDALDLDPVSRGDVAWAVVDPQGMSLASGIAGLSDYGVTHWSVTLPENATTGTYTLRAALGGTISERSVVVGPYALPPFEVDVTTTRDFYAPGDEVAGEVMAAYFFGKPVAGAEVVLRGTTEGGGSAPVVELRGTTDADGRYRFALRLPKEPEATLEATVLGTTFLLEAEVTDTAGQRAGIRHPLAVSPTPILIRAVPESGVLKPGVENRVYVMTTYPDGRPAPTTLTVDIDTGEDPEAQTVDTGPYGLAVVRFVPRDETLLNVTAQDPDGLQASASVLLQADEAPNVLLLHVDRAAYVAGETLQATALVSGEALETVYLDVVQAGQMVAGLSAPVTEGRAAFALDLDPTMVGALRLRAYALGGEGPAPRAEDGRLVVVDPPRSLDVTVQADRDRYAPGDVAELEIETARREDGGSTPVAAALGISVVDASVFALDTLPPSFARTYFLLSDAMLAQRGQVAGLDLPALLAREADRRDAQDLAARAAWADAPVTDASLRGEFAVLTRDRGAAARRNLVRALSAILGALPVALGLVVGRHLRRLGLLGATLKRLGWGLLILALLSPILVVGLVVGLLLPSLGAALFIGALGAAAVALLILAVHGWRRRNPVLQLFTGLLITYLILAGLLLGLAAQGTDVGVLPILLIVATFLLLVFTTAAEGQALVLNGRRKIGWLATVLALLLVLMALAVPAMDALASDLTRAIGNPTLYVGPLGWLTGCGAATPAPEPDEEPAAEGEAAEPTALATQPAGETATPAPQPTATPPSVPAEPYPLRQLFPETLYWDPAAQTGDDGRLALDLALADTLTAWRVTALASTLEGDVGAASIDLPVLQPLFVEVTVPDDVRAGEPVTLTLTAYNFTPETQTVRWRTPPEEGFEELVAPAAVEVLPERGAGATWVIRPAQAGTLSLAIEAQGEDAGDRILVELEVQEP